MMMKMDPQDHQQQRTNDDVKVKSNKNELRLRDDVFAIREGEGETFVIRQQQQQQQQKDQDQDGISSSSNNNNNNNNNMTLKNVNNDDNGNINKILSSKRNAMSIEERDHGLHELHGVWVDDIIKEVEEEQQKLTEMSKLANSLLLQGSTRSQNNKSNNNNNEEQISAYRIALQQNQEYVQKIQLLCLRSDYYDVKKATTRMFSFFTFKQRLFGTSKLTKDICHEDFYDREEDQIALQSGMWQLLPGKDRASRAISFYMNQNASMYSIESIVRVFYYVHMTALKDEDIQRKGIVHINYQMGRIDYISDRPKKYADIWWCLPIRLNAMHICYDSSFVDIAVQMMVQSMESHHLCRLRTHKGSDQECIYELMTFGIPKEIIPINIDKNGGSSTLNVELHHQWLESMKIKEHHQYQHYQKATTTPAAILSSSTNSNVADSNNTLTPPITTSNSTTAAAATTTTSSSNNPNNEVVVFGPMDIVIGLGRKSDNSSIGYLKLRNLTSDYRDEYENASRYEKTIITYTILKKLYEDGCRFVRCTKDLSIINVCDDVDAREKISKTFRNMRQQANRKLQQQQQQSSSTTRSLQGRETGSTKRRISY